MLCPNHDHLAIGHLSQLQVLHLPVRLDRQQILNLFVVDLQVLNAELNRGTFCLDDAVDRLKNIANCSRNDSIHALDIDGNSVSSAIFNGIDDGVRPKHGECLARATLAVGEDSTVEAI